jgi:hypothetical protein
MISILSNSTLIEPMLASIMQQHKDVHKNFRNKKLTSKEAACLGQDTGSQSLMHFQGQRIC